MLREASATLCRAVTRPAYFPSPQDAFSEKAFYLQEFRGRTLLLAGTAESWSAGPDPEPLLRELEANETRVLLLGTDAAWLTATSGRAPLSAASRRLSGQVWRAFASSRRFALLAEERAGFAASWREVARRLALDKVVIVDATGGLQAASGERISFVDLEALRRLLREPEPVRDAERVRLLREIERALTAGVTSLNLTTPAGLEDELFTYAGSGTLFTRERYIAVRRLGLDDFDAAADLVQRGIAEGYLAPRTQAALDDILAAGFGAFVEGRHLAGIGALIEHVRAGAAEIAALYTLTRFLGEGVGAHLVHFALERARDRGFNYAFACTTSERVAGFFERHGLRRVSWEDLPPAKWKGYDPERRDRLICLRIDLR